MRFLAGEDYHWWRQKTSLKGRTGWGDKHLIDAHVGNIWDAANAGATNDCATVVASYGVDRCWRPSPKALSDDPAGCIFGCPRQ